MKTRPCAERNIRLFRGHIKEVEEGIGKVAMSFHKIFPVLKEN